MLLLVLISVSLAAGFAVWALALRYPKDSLTGQPTMDFAHEAGETASRHHWRRVVQARRHPDTATGLALTLAALVIIAGASIVGLLAYLVRGDSRLVTLDESLSRWANRHQSDFAIDVINAITHLGATPTVIVLAV